MQLVRNGVNDFGNGYVDNIQGNVAQFDRLMQQKKLDNEKKDALFAQGLADVNTDGVYSKDQPYVAKAYNDFRDWAIKNRNIKGTRAENLSFQAEMTQKKKALLNAIEYTKQSRKEGGDYYKNFGTKFSENGTNQYRDWMDKPLINEDGSKNTVNFKDFEFQSKDFNINPFVQNTIKNSIKLNQQIGDSKTIKDGRDQTQFGDVVNVPSIMQGSKRDYQGNGDYRNYIDGVYNSTPELKARYPKAEDAAGAIMLKIAVPSITNEDYIKALDGGMNEIIMNGHSKNGGSRYSTGGSGSSSKAAEGARTREERQQVIDVFNAATFNPGDETNAMAQSYVGFVKQAADKAGYQTSVRFQNGVLTIDGKDKFGDPLESALSTIDFRKPGAQGQLSLLFDGLYSSAKRLGTNGWNIADSPYATEIKKSWGGNKAATQDNTFKVNPFDFSKTFTQPTKAKQAPAPKSGKKVVTPVKQDKSNLTKAASDIFN